MRTALANNALSKAAISGNELAIVPVFVKQLFSAQTCRLGPKQTQIITLTAPVVLSLSSHLTLLQISL